MRHLQETVAERGLLDDRDMFAYPKRPIVYLALLVLVGEEGEENIRVEKSASSNVDYILVGYKSSIK